MTYLLIVRYRTPSGGWRRYSSRVCFGQGELHEALRSYAQPYYRIDFRTFSRDKVAQLLESA